MNTFQVVINVLKKANRSKGVERGGTPFFDGMVGEGLSDEVTFLNSLG